MPPKNRNQDDHSDADSDSDAGRLGPERRYYAVASPGEAALVATSGPLDPPTMVNRTPGKDPRHVALINLRVIAVLEQNDLPVFTKVGDVQARALVARLRRGKEFAVCPLFDPAIVEACCQQGIFPMTMCIGQGLALFAAKIHVSRCVVDLTQRVVVSRSHVKRARHFGVVIDDPAMFEPVCRMVLDAHGGDTARCWLTPALRQCLHHMFVHSDQYATKIHIIALVENETVVPQPPTTTATTTGDEAMPAACPPGPVVRIVAGEIGFSVGNIFASMTGAFTKTGSGSAQLTVLRELLVRCGYKHWDLGMAMKYKTAMLHGEEMPRARWLSCVAANRHVPPSVALLSSYRGRTLDTPRVLFPPSAPPAPPVASKDTSEAAVAAAAAKRQKKEEKKKRGLLGREQRNAAATEETSAE